MATEKAFHDLVFTLPNDALNSDFSNTLGLLKNMLTAYQVTEINAAASITGSGALQHIPPNSATPTALTLTLAGLCFAPYKHENAGKTEFETISFRVCLVFWEHEANGNNNKMLILPQDHEKAYIIKPDSTLSNLATAASGPKIGQTEKNGGINLGGDYLIFNSFTDWWNTTKRINDTREFDYTFLDIDTYLYFTQNGQFDTADQTKAPTGLFATRANYTLPLKQTALGQPEYITFRTLNFTPFPLPTTTASVPNRNDIAYYIGPTCPPWWRYEIEATNQGIITGKIVPPLAMSRQADPQPSENKKFDTLALRESLLAAGYIYEGHEPIKLWGPFLIRVLLNLLLIGLSIWGLSSVLKSGE